MVQFSQSGKQLIKEESARGVPFFPKLAGVNYWRPEVVGLMHNSGKGTYLFTNVMLSMKSSTYLYHCTNKINVAFTVFIEKKKAIMITMFYLLIFVEWRAKMSFNGYVIICRRQTDGLTTEGQNATFICVIIVVSLKQNLFYRSKLIYECFDVSDSLSTMQRYETIVVSN